MDITTYKNQERISLKNLKVHTRLSEETPCYTASIYFDGKKVAEVENRGDGGCDNHYITNQPGWDEMQNYVDTFEPEVWNHGDSCGAMMPDIEWVCAELINDWYVERDLKALLRKRVLFLRPDAEGIYQTKALRNKAAVEAAAIRYADDERVSKILNLMPFDGALAIYREHAGRA
jgi:hypothetical protein